MLRWPDPYDAAAGERLLERFGALGDDAARILAIPGVRAMMMGVGGNSPYLAELAIREPAALEQFVTAGPDAAFAAVLAELGQMPATERRPGIAAALRQAKREAALVIALADIGGARALEQVTGALSELAEATLRLALRHLLRTAHDAGEIKLRDPGRPELECGFAALAMGKLGAGELNYSSDIDLILIYDATAPVFAGGRARDGIGSFTSRIARDIVTLMEARDANGYVFRTDLRLRPDPAATPPAV